ncbi:MAG: preprotein translocase subunit YajC [Planctomycetes bacterium]|nr:preprotein translocase subunit YajC [Planctomycetota bacterium]
MIMLLLMLAFMYFVLIRPQGKEQKRRKNMMSAIKVGDKVVTIGGIHGVIERCGEEDVDVKVTDGTLITFNLGAVSQVVQDGDKIKGQE